MTLTIGQGKLIAEGSATVTVTHVPSGITATVPVSSSNGSNLPDPTTNQLLRISADTYAGDDTALRNDMWADDPGSFASGHKGYYDTSSKAPKGTGPGVPFPYMTFGDLITLDATNTWRGKATFRERFPGSQDLTAQTIAHYLSQDGLGVQNSLWIKQVFRIDPTGTSGQPFFYGTGGGGIGYKHISFSFSNYGGRLETEWENGSTTGGRLGTTSNPLNLSDGSSAGSFGSGYDGGTWQNGPTQTAAFTNGKWYALVGLMTPHGTNATRLTWWLGPDDGSSPMVKQVDLIFSLNSGNWASNGGPGVPTADRIPIFGENCNQVRSNTNDVYINRADTVLFRPVDVADPWGVLNVATPVASSLSVSTLARGASGSTVTITGSNFDQNCFPVFSNPGITATPDFSYGKSNRTSLVLSVSVASGATPGAGTVKVSSNTENDSGTLVFTVT